MEKRVPHGAGLGGGSANAATALWAANELSGRLATNDQLLDWSGAIGSDISVFFSRGAAYCTGRCAPPSPPNKTNTNVKMVINNIICETMLYSIVLNGTKTSDSTHAASHLMSMQH